MITAVLEFEERLSVVASGDLSESVATRTI
jgi:hypothetical protein